MDIIILLYETIVSTLVSMGKIALILVPVLIMIELARHFKIIELLTGKIKGLLKFISLPEEAALPLFAGIFFGIVLGSALIIEYSREGFLQKRDLLLIGIFLSISHSVIEDTFLFSVFGANPVIMITTRTILAVIITRGAAYIFDHFSNKKVA